jgi:hypothetical protein
MLRISVILLSCLWMSSDYRGTPNIIDYDKVILSDHPVAYWADATGKDLTGHNHPGVLKAGTARTSMPDGSQAMDINGQDQYMEVASDAELSVPATKVLTIEAWMRPDVLDFDKVEGSGYVYWLGKGAPGQHEYAGRMYGQHPAGHDADRANRISGYVFNASGGLGAGSYYQAPAGDPIRVGEWIHYVLIINTTEAASSGKFPTGYTKLYVIRKGRPAKTDQDALAGYHIVPAAGNAPFRVGTRDFGSFFKGAIGKIAIYNYELSARQIEAHSREMWR